MAAVEDSDADREEDGTDRAEKVESLAKTLKIPKPEADRLLANMEDGT